MTGDTQSPLISKSPDDTRAVGRLLGKQLRGGELIALSGALGAGKTQFVKGLAVGIGVPESEPVVSPTFVLIREYYGRLKLYHIDAYRMSDAVELFDLGLAEMRAEPDAVVAIEWADRTPEATTDNAIEIRIEHVSDSERSIYISGLPPGQLAEISHALRTPGSD